jgi:cytidylate kinase
MIIAIDGPAAAGKGTLAQRLAQYFDLAFLDTGRLYRAVAYEIYKSGVDPNDTKSVVLVARSLEPDKIEVIDLYTEKIAEIASVIAAMAAVRNELLVYQRNFAYNPPSGKTGAVLDGRDIASVVCPDASYKFFVTARLDVRSRRRFKELQENGRKSTYAAVLADIQQRDDRDRTRKVSPLKTVDAIVIDTSGKSPDAVFLQALEYIEGDQLN